MEEYQIGDFRIEVLHNPSVSLSAPEKEQLIQQAIPVTRLAFGNEGVTETDVITHALEVSTAIYIKNRAGDLLAFSTCVTEQVGDNRIIHLKGSAVHPDQQGNHLYSILVPLRVLFEAEQQVSERLFVGTRTQNPRVYEKTVKLGLYPRIDEPTPDWLKPIARDYAALIRDRHSDFKSTRGLEFDSDNFVVRRTYGFINEHGNEQTFSMYRIPPKAKDESINVFMEKRLDFENGDTILLIGPYNKSACLRMLSEYPGDINPIAKRFA